MAHINLLPWREELRKRRQKEFGITAVIAVLVMLVIVAGVHFQYVKWIEYQQRRNQFLQQQITRLDQKIAEIKKLDEEKARLIARMEIIQRLQASRPEIVHLVDELVTTLPEGVYYEKITQKGPTLTLQGVAQSNARVSSLMRNLDASDWMKDPALLEIKAQEGKQGTPEQVRLSQFSLQVTQTSPRSDEEAMADGEKKAK